MPILKLFTDLNWGKIHFKKSDIKVTSFTFYITPKKKQKPFCH